MVVETAPAALLVKRSAGEINVIVHVVGILVALPKILEPGELVQRLSLGARNTGRAHDLEERYQIELDEASLTPETTVHDLESAAISPGRHCDGYLRTARRVSAGHRPCDDHA